VYGGEKTLVSLSLPASGRERGEKGRGENTQHVFLSQRLLEEKKKRKITTLSNLAAVSCLVGKKRRGGREGEGEGSNIPFPRGLPKKGETLPSSSMARKKEKCRPVGRKRGSDNLVPTREKSGADLHWLGKERGKGGGGHF